MKIIISTIILILILSGVAFLLRLNFRDYKNISYEIEGEIIGLRNGISKDNIGPKEASSEISTRSIGYDIKADFNNDGAEDVAFMVTQYGGGSGTFYYLVAALKSKGTYKGTNAVFIGDRIKPQNVEYKDGRVIVYYLDRKDDEPFTANPTIKKIKYFKAEGLKLIEAIPARNTITKATDKYWEGEWVLENAIQDYSGTLTIKNQIANSFSFSLDTYNGAHVGNVDGEAKIAGASASGTVGDASEKEYQCQVDFSKNEDKIEIKTTNGDCSYFRGARAFFAGIYIKNGTVKERALKDIVRVYGGGGPDETDRHIFKNDEELNTFQRMVGDNYVKLFTSSFQLVFRADDMEYLNARVYTGGVAGLYTILEGIIIIGNDSPTKIWAAAIDDDVVRYFTNVSGYTNNLPESIEKWRERFQDKKVIFMNGR